jgi:hypothetical protein
LPVSLPYLPGLSERKKRRNLEKAAGLDAAPQYRTVNPTYPNEIMPMYTNQPHYMVPTVNQPPQEVEGLKNQLHEMEGYQGRGNNELAAKSSMPRML